MKVIATLIFIIITSTSFGQSNDFSYKIGTPHLLNYYGHNFSKDNKILSIKSTKKEFFLQLFDSETMNEVKQKSLIVDFEYDSYTIHQMDEHIYMFYQKWDKKAGNEQLFVREIDFDNCSLMGSSKLLVKLNRKIVGGKFEYEFSNDEKVLMLWCRTVPDSRLDVVNKDVIGMYTFDSEMNNISSGSYQMPYTEAVMDNISYTVDAVGNAYILTEVLINPKEKKITKDGNINYRLELVKVDIGGAVSNTVLNSLDKRLLDLKFEEGKNNELSIVGFYSNSKKAKIQDGIFFSKIVNDEVVDYRYYDFPSDVVKKYLNLKKNKSKSKNENVEDITSMSLSNYQVKSINYDDEGVTIFIEFYLHSSSTDSKTNSTTHYYDFGDIIGMRIDKDGELLWMNKFPKNQYGVNSTVSLGFKEMSNEKNNYLIFMDSKANSELQTDQYPSHYYAGSPGVLTGFKIDRMTGEFERLSILNFEEVDVNGKRIINFSPNQIVPLNSEEFATECGLRKAKSKVMIKVTLN